MHDCEAHRFFDHLSVLLSVIDLLEPLESVALDSELDQVQNSVHSLLGSAMWTLIVLLDLLVRISIEDFFTEMIITDSVKPHPTRCTLNHLNISVFPELLTDRAILSFLSLSITDRTQIVSSRPSAILVLASFLGVTDGALNTIFAFPVNRLISRDLGH